MFKHFKLIPFIIGLLIGIVGIYFVKQEGHVTMRYPTPQNIESTVYKDKNGVCYKYDAKKVDCDKNQDRLKTYPVS
uniref:Uncharacterized protein n=1 Tax=viral metagenome TaxID=1070528 RepID=A0A6C0DGY7_9ZZZZ